MRKLSKPLAAAAHASVPPKTASGKNASTSDSERRAAHIAHQFDVSIYCDGACEPNPGNAGSGIVVYRAGKLAELWYGLYNPRGTNNTAELNALYHALRMAEAEIKTGNSVEVCSDSAYAINCIRSWAPGWEKKGWKKPGGEIKNLEIIQDCYAIYRRIKKQLTLTHVAAHVGTEGNELADRMAMLGVELKKKNCVLSGDNGYPDAAEDAGGVSSKRLSADQSFVAVQDLIRMFSLILNETSNSINEDAAIRRIFNGTASFMPAHKLHKQFSVIIG